MVKISRDYLHFFFLKKKLFLKKFAFSSSHDKKSKNYPIILKFGCWRITVQVWGVFALVMSGDACAIASTRGRVGRWREVATRTVTWAQVSRLTAVSSAGSFQCSLWRRASTLSSTSRADLVGSFREYNDAHRYTVVRLGVCIHSRAGNSRVRL